LVVGVVLVLFQPLLARQFNMLAVAVAVLLVLLVQAALLMA
jgi:hypothetical protein